MNLLGITKLGAVITLDDMPKEEREEFTSNRILGLMTSHIGLAATLLLSVISEFQNYFRFQADIELRMLVLWHTLLPDFVDARNIFDKRYKSLFPAPLIELSK